MTNPTPNTPSKPVQVPFDPQPTQHVIPHGNPDIDSRGVPPGNQSATPKVEPKASFDKPKTGDRVNNLSMDKDTPPTRRSTTPAMTPQPVPFDDKTKISKQTGNQDPISKQDTPGTKATPASQAPGLTNQNPQPTDGNASSTHDLLQPNIQLHEIKIPPSTPAETLSKGTTQPANPPTDANLSQGNQQQQLPANPTSSQLHLH